MSARDELLALIAKEESRFRWPDFDPKEGRSSLNPLPWSRWTRDNCTLPGCNWKAYDFYYSQYWRAPTRRDWLEHIEWEHNARRTLFDLAARRLELQMTVNVAPQAHMLLIGEVNEMSMARCGYVWMPTGDYEPGGPQCPDCDVAEETKDLYKTGEWIR